MEKCLYFVLDDGERVIMLVEELSLCEGNDSGSDVEDGGFLGGLQRFDLLLDGGEGKSDGWASHRVN